MDKRPRLTSNDYIVDMNETIFGSRSNSIDSKPNSRSNSIGNNFILDEELNENINLHVSEINVAFNLQKQSNKKYEIHKYMVNYNESIPKKITKRVRDQPIEGTISKSPIPDKSKYFTWYNK
jgi:hypothetical protein